MYTIHYVKDEYTLYIHMQGKIRTNTLEKLKKDLYKITEESGILEVIFYTASAKYLEREAFCNLVDDYDSMYGKKIHILDNQYAVI